MTNVEHDDVLTQVEDKASREAQLVAQHYNRRPDLGREARKDSVIVRLRAFNNWIKTVLITAHILKPGSTALDLGCGKGGDIGKWRKAKISHLVGMDIAQESINHAKARFDDRMDCYGEPISRSILPNIAFDIVSMQFCMHYAFNTEQRVRMMLHNVSSQLKVGGMFVGTIPNSNWLVRKLRNPVPNEFGNSVYKVRFEDPDQISSRTFGCKYYFTLVDAVEDCAEYLVHFPSFEKIAREFGLTLLFKKSFHEYYQSALKHSHNKQLLYNMRVILDSHQAANTGEPAHMTPDEWECANIYMVFAFKKESPYVGPAPSMS
ncbi:mRNA capping enzyme, large subunit [Ramicandelaber brevisporus]|nr:mRNA capping enzyme, large subunit [Ramicandelaber brevisporus]